ncbi:Rpn family recombination-promoting nuclease/putative transposase [Nocardia sp. NPDC048505]|uniref:Rpn family recombination-promoting nuclease/putative transposase n=1 Tax=Nocardia sp. NPDC048505 TaxID=3155756 RepID=UPI00340A73BD
MAITPSNPHDALFRRVLGQPANATSQLRRVLPEAVAARMDWKRLELMSCSFVSEELRSSYCDLAFRTTCDGRDAFVYLLVEHQSCPDRLMPLRMLGYITGLWNHYRAKNPKAVTLPLVVPIVVHANSTGRPWSSPMEIADLYDADPEVRQILEPHLPRFQFLLDDVAAVDFPTLQARKLAQPVQMMFYLLKTDLRDADLETVVQKLKPLEEAIRTTASAPDGVDALIPYLTYILLTSEVSVRDLGPYLERITPRAKEALMTTGERIRASAYSEGRAEGHSEGHAEGRAEGRAEGQASGIAIGEANARAQDLTDLLTVKFGPLPAHILGIIHVGTTTEQKAWMQRLLTATTLDEVFAD